MSAGDRATVSVLVAVPQAIAFQVFTCEIDLWWRKGPKFRFGRQPGALTFEPFLGGRLFESFSSESGTHVREVGRVIVWEPPARLVFSWRNVNFADDESTDVEVLEKLSEKHPLPQLILDYRSMVKLKNTYLDNLTEYVNPKTGRIHGSFNQAGAATGRLSMSAIRAPGSRLSRIITPALILVCVLPGPGAGLPASFKLVPANDKDGPRPTWTRVNDNTWEEQIPGKRPVRYEQVDAPIDPKDPGIVVTRLPHRDMQVFVPTLDNKDRRMGWRYPPGKEPKDAPPKGGGATWYTLGEMTDAN